MFIYSIRILKNGFIAHTADRKNFPSIVFKAKIFDDVTPLKFAPNVYSYGVIDGHLQFAAFEILNLVILLPRRKWSASEWKLVWAKFVFIAKSSSAQTEQK